MADFVHLHVHSFYSLLDGGNRISSLVAKASELGMRAIALTDHGNLYGAIEFYLAAQKAGVRPILGMEAYVAPRGRFSRDGSARDAAAHLVLLAMNERGWANLRTLSTQAFLEGFYYKPRIDRELLARHHEGLICTSACLSGEIPRALLAGREDEARRIAGEYRDIFGRDRFFIEIQNQGVADQTRINPELVRLARDLGLGLVGTNDVHFLRRCDKEAHHTLTCISTKRTADDPDALDHPEELYLKSPSEMAEALGEWPEAVANTLRIAEMCDLRLDFSRKHLPQFPTPDGSSPDEYLRRLAHEGLRARFGGREPPAPYRERLDRELAVIAGKGYSSYFLIVNDFVQFARRNGIPAAPRGSGVATLLGWALGIANVDPIRYGLLFERFTDPQRKEDPDVDIDICQVGRARVLQYVRQKYGHVAQIITYGTLKPRAVVRDVARVFKWPLDRVEKIVKLIPEGARTSLAALLGLTEGDEDEGDEEDSGAPPSAPELRAEYDRDPEARRLIDLAREIEGAQRHAGVHAAGVVVCDRPLEEIVPLCRPSDRPDTITQWDGPTCEKVGLMKMDLLGLKTLSVLQRARELVRQRTGVDVDPDQLPLDDDAVYALFRAGDTDAVFQFESPGMKRVLIEMQPTRIEDLIAANAMFRPGPMELIPSYCRRKAGHEPVERIHPLVDDILAETYGVMIYQEQVMQVLNRLGGLPLGRALTLIKAISKKKRDVIESERAAFIEGARRNGIGAAEAQRLFELISRFAGYGFNKAHSTGYAILAYQTAWFKRHHPAEFWAATLTFECDKIEKLGQYIAIAVKSGVPVLPPDINLSDVEFSVNDGAVRFGLAAVKGVGEAAVRAILEARRKVGRFADLDHFCRVVDRRAVNRAAIEALIRCGAFDRCGGSHRAQMLAALDAVLASAADAAQDRASGQLSLFGAEELTGMRRWPEVPRWSLAELLAAERETLGLSLTGHPTEEHRWALAALRWPVSLSLAHPPPPGDGPPVRVGGAIARLTYQTVKRGRTMGRRMAVFTIEDGATGELEVVLFPDALERCAPELLREGAVVVVEGMVQANYQNRVSLAAERVMSVEEALNRCVGRLTVRLPAAMLDDAEALSALEDALRAHHGTRPVEFEVEWSDSPRRLRIRAGPAWSVTVGKPLVERLAGLVGEAAIRAMPMPVETPAPRPVRPARTEPVA
ncbi:MAG: DNA polymerase III subunit alpha [Kiritimatiellae bacterium]|nr:DNA polymerase III subunit alpha [Kiritimatiellia bacterium]